MSNQVTQPANAAAGQPVVKPNPIADKMALAQAIRVKPADTAAAKPATEVAKTEETPAAAQDEAVETPATEAGTSAEVTPPAEVSKFDRAKQASDKARSAAKKNRERQLEQQRINYQMEEVRRQNARLQQETAQARQFQEQLRSDPIAALRQLGVTDQAVAERMLKDGSPEAQIRQLEARLEAERQERLQERQQLQQKEAQLREQEANADFVRKASDAEKFPNLQDVPPSQIVAGGYRLLAAARARGIDTRMYTAEDFIELLDLEYAEHRKSKATVRSKETMSQVTTGSGTEKKPAAATTTLTNRLGTQGGSTPVDRDQLSPIEQKQLLAAEIRKALKKT